jgi:hypothetical protein
MPAPCRPPAAVEELLSAQPEPGDDVLEVGHGGRRSSQHGGVEETSSGRPADRARRAAADLEASVGNVLVRHPVDGEVQRRAERESKRPRANQRTGRAAGRDMERDDHRSDDRVCSGDGLLATDFGRMQAARPRQPEDGRPGRGRRGLHEEFSVPNAATPNERYRRALRSPGRTHRSGPFSGRARSERRSSKRNHQPEDVKPDDAKIESEPDPVDPDTSRDRSRCGSVPGGVPGRLVGVSR